MVDTDNKNQTNPLNPDQKSANSSPTVMIPPTIRWSPLGGAISYFGTHKLLGDPTGNRVEVVSTQKEAIFYVFFGLVGLLIGGIGIVMLSTFEIVFGVACIGIAYYLKRSSAYDKGIFDKRIGWYWIGDTALTDPKQIAELEDSCQLSDVYALQLLIEEVSLSDMDYDCFELNMIKHNGDRVPVMRHGSGKSMSADAQKLSSFLGVKLFNRLK